MLIHDIKKLQIAARKTRSEEASILTTLYSEAANVGLNDGKRDSTDAEVIATIKKFIKNAEEVIAVSTGYTGAGFEIEILKSLLPKQLTEAELSTIISVIVHTNQVTSMQQMGIVMGKLKKEYAGLYDGKMASDMIKKQISGS